MTSQKTSIRNVALLLTLLLTAGGKVSAQLDYNTLMAASPTAAALGQYGEVPVGYYTGTPNIQIPLGTIKGAELELPVTLSYMARGVKVEENASWVGTGWSLNCTGVITRTVRGLEDGESPRVAFPLPNDTESAAEHQLMIEILADIEHKLKDPEPDLFFFNFPGYSGSFVLDENDEAVIDDEKNIRIKFEHTTTYKFTITTEDGTQYIFDRPENTTYHGATTESGNSALYLSKIISPTGREEIYFSYASEITKHYSLSRPTRMVRPDNVVYDLHPPVFGITIINSLRLEQVTTNFGQNIRLMPHDDNNPRRDLAPVSSAALQPKALKEISFYDQNNDVKKKFTFEYETVETSRLYTQLKGTDPPADINTQYANYRLYLKSVKEASSDMNDKPPYTFTYDGRSSQNKDLLPNKLSPAQDHWGYFNGSTNQELWPGYSGPFGSFDSEFNLITIQPTGIACPEIAKLVARPSFTVSGANRNPNAATMGYGILKAIGYPTGGRTTFAFEPHKYTYEANNGRPVTKKVETGMQVYLSGSGSELETTAGKKASQHGRFSFEFTVTCWDPNTHQPMPCDQAGSQVNFDKFQGNSVALFNSANEEVVAAKWMPGDGGFWIYRNGVVDSQIGILRPDASGFITMELDDIPLPFDDYTLKATKDPDCTTDVFGWFYVQEDVYVDITNQNEAVLAGGVRIAKIQNYDAQDNLVTEKTYDYGVGVLLEGPRYAIYTWKSELSTPQIFQPCPRNAQDDVDSYPYLLISCGSHSALGYTQGSAIGYRKVIEHYTNGTKTNGSVEYEYTTGIEYPDNAEPWSNTVSYIFGQLLDDNSRVWLHMYWENHKVVWPFISQDNLDRKRGFLKKVTTKDATGQAVRITENTPEIYESGSISGVRVQTFRSELDWMYSIYRYSSGRVNIGSTTDTQLASGYEITTTVSSFDHDAQHHNFLTQKTITDSDGSTYTTQYRYPDDYTTITDLNHVIAQMKSDKLHIIGSPIETRVFKDGQIIGGTLNVPTKVTKNGGGFFVAPLSFYRRREGVSATQWLPDPTVPDATIYFKDSDFTFHGSGALVSVMSKGQKISLCWTNGIAFPVAKVLNAEPAEVFFTSFETLGEIQAAPAKTGTRYWNSGTFNFSIDAAFVPSNPSALKMSYWYWLTDHWEFSGEMNFANMISSPGSRLDEIRVYPKGAQMTSFTYNPLVGMSSMTDPNNITTFYEYDGLERLKLVRDDDHNIRQSYQYRYKGQ